MEKHHWIPLSLYGLDHGANIIAVGNELHKTIHKTMNYPYRKFTRIWRTFRKRHNGKHYMDEKMATDILKMQEGYLDRWTKLPPIAQKMHFQKMNELTAIYNPNHRWDSNWNYLWKKYVVAFKKYHLK